MDKKNRKRIRRSLRLAMMGLLGSGYLYMAAELTMYLMGMPSICQTQACGMAESSLGVDKTWLYVGAMAWSAALFGLLTWNKKRALPLFVALFYAGLAFEGVLLGYLLQNDIPCILCFGVASCLVALILMFTGCHARFGLGGIGVWIASIAATLLLVGGVQGKHQSIKHLDLERSAFLKIEGKSKTQYHLFINYSCPNCIVVIKALSKVGTPLPGTWYIHNPTGNLPKRLARRMLYTIQNNKAGSIKPLYDSKLMAMDQLPEISGGAREALEMQTRDALKDLKVFGVSGVPALIVKRGNIQAVLVGPMSILNYLSR